MVSEKSYAVITTMTMGMKLMRSTGVKNGEVDEQRR